MTATRSGVCSTCRVALQADERCDLHPTARVVPGAEICVLHSEAPTVKAARVPVRRRRRSLLAVGVSSSVATTGAELLADLDVLGLAAVAVSVGVLAWVVMDRWATNMMRQQVGSWRTSPEIARHAENGRVGTVVGEASIRAPLSGKACVAYGLVAEDAAGSGLLVDAHAAPFTIRSDDGTVHEMSAARLRFESLIPPDQTSRGATPMLRALAALGIHGETAMLTNARCEEHLVHAGDRVSLLVPFGESGIQRWPVLVLMRRATI